LNQCSFCGRSEDEVKKLIAGAHAFICNECVVVCSEVLAAGGTMSPGTGVDAKRTKTRARPGGKTAWSGYDPAPRDATDE
jgi:hypothetical protein